MKKYFVFLVSLFFLYSCTEDKEEYENTPPLKEYKLDKFELLEGEENEKEDIKVVYSTSGVTNMTDVPVTYMHPQFEKALNNESVFEIESVLPLGFIIPDNLYVTVEEGALPQKELFSLIPQYTKRIFSFGGSKTQVPSYSEFVLKYNVLGYKQSKPFQAVFVEAVSGDMIELKGVWKEVIYEYSEEDGKIASLNE